MLVGYCDIGEDKLNLARPPPFQVPTRRKNGKAACPDLTWHWALAMELPTGPGTRLNLINQLQEHIVVKVLTRSH